MKKFLIGLNIVIWSVLGFQVAHAQETKPTTKKVCVDQKDSKTGKTKQVCKDVKVHKKQEGTKVPEKAPAKKPAGKAEPKK